MTENSEGFGVLALALQAPKKPLGGTPPCSPAKFPVVSLSVVEIMGFRILVATNHSKCDFNQTIGSKYLMKYENWSFLTAYRQQWIDR
jgi:hypothetical protein